MAGWRCAPAVSTTTIAACSPRSRRERPTRVLLYPRGDLRRTTDRMPSRFLLDTVEALTGTRHYADDLLQLDVDWFRQVPSFAAGIGACPFPATEQEHRLRALLDHTYQGGDIATSALRVGDHALDVASIAHSRVRVRHSRGSTATSEASPYRARPASTRLCRPLGSSVGPVRPSTT